MLLVLQAEPFGWWAAYNLVRSRRMQLRAYLSSTGNESKRIPPSQLVGRINRFLYRSLKDLSPLRCSPSNIQVVNTDMFHHLIISRISANIRQKERRDGIIDFDAEQEAYNKTDWRNHYGIGHAVTDSSPWSDADMNWPVIWQKRKVV